MTMQWYTHPPPTITELLSTRTICPPQPGRPPDCLTKIPKQLLTERHGRTSTPQDTVQPSSRD